MLSLRLAAFVWLCTALLSGCGEQDLGSFPGVEIDPDLTLDEMHQVPSAVDLRITEKGLGNLLDEMLPSLLGEGQSNPDGTMTLDLSILPEELLSTPLNFGPFHSGSTLREVTISIDMTKLKLSFLPSNGPIRIRMQATDLPLRIDHAIIAGEVSVFGLQSDTACRLMTQAPEMTTLIDIDAVVTLTSLPDQGFETDLDISLLDIKDINLEVEKDCSFPECADQVLFEPACIECEICDSSLLTPDLLNGLRDLLGDAFHQLLTFLVQTMIDVQLGDQFNQLLQDIGLRIQLGQLLGSLSPGIEPVTSFWREVELKSKPSVAGFSSINGDLMAGLDLGLRAPEDGCGANRAFPATIEALSPLEWSDTTPLGLDYDLGFRLRPELIERFALALFKTGLGCTTLRPQDIQALTGLELVLNQNTMHLLFPEFMGLGDPDLPLRFQLDLAEDEIYPIEFSATVHETGGVRIDFSMSGLEVIVSADGRHGASWLAMKPSIDGTIKVSLDPQSGELQLQIEAIKLQGLGDSTTPLTASSDTKGLLEGIEGFANELSFGDPISLSVSELLEPLLPGTEIVDISATSDGRLELYLRFNDTPQGQETDTEAAAGLLYSLDSSPKPPLMPLIWFCLAILFWAIRALPKLVRGTGLAVCLCGLIFAPACEPTHLGSYCTSDTDCGTGYLCNEEGSCVLGVPCASNADCCAGFVCVQGLCSQGADCATTGCPLPGTECVEGLCLAQSCASADQCPATAPCEEGFCTHLVCPEGQALDRPGAHCMNLPDSCANLVCPPGSLPEILGGPVTGLQCPNEDIDCDCMVAREIAGPRPSGAITVTSTGEIFWHDARYGDLVVSTSPEETTTFEEFVAQANSTIIDGLPEDPLTSGATSSWRAGVQAPGPDVGRSIASLSWPGDLILIAAIGDPDRSLVVHAFNPETQSTEKVLDFPGRVLAGPVLHKSPEDRACVSFVHSSDVYTRKLRVFCSHRPELSGSFTESFSLALSPEPFDPTSCGAQGCAEGSLCVRSPNDSIECALKSGECAESCETGWSCVSPHGCAPLVYPQDKVEQQNLDVLSVSKGDGPNIFVTTSVSPSQVIAVRWFGAKNYSSVPVLTLPAAGGRGMLSGASMHDTQETRILLSLDSWPNLYRFQWPNSEEHPTKLEPQYFDLPGGSRIRVRDLRVGPSHEGAPTWLMRTQPDDQLIWVQIDTEGPKILKTLSPGAVVGTSDTIDSELWGWGVDPSTGSFSLHRWTLTTDAP